MSFLDVHERLMAIATGRGSAGELGAEAQSHAVPAKLFRPTELDPASDAVEGSHIDRSLKILYRDRTDTRPRNTRSPKRDHTHRFTVRIGYITALHGDAYKAVHLGPDGTTDEERRDAALRWEQRAHNDAERLIEALLYHELTGSDTNPIIENVRHLSTQTNPRDNGRGYCDVDFEMWAEETV